MIGLGLVRSLELNLPANLGYGANQHKRLRRAVPAMEYNAFYTRHLPPRQRMTWSLFIGGTNAAAAMRIALRAFCDAL